MNPYQVLGVSENATDEEVRSAYLKLVKKYHPDKYQDNPLQALAGEKLKQVNEAYDTITKLRSGQSAGANAGAGGFGAGFGTNGGFGSGGFSTGASNYSGEYASEFVRARSCLNSNSVREARAILEAIPVRNAEWNYLYGITLYRSGEYGAARNYLELATQLDPANSEYRNAYKATFAQGARNYHNYDGDSGGASINRACNVCTTLICLDSCCECFGGDLIRCC